MKEFVDGEYIYCAKAVEESPNSYVAYYQIKYTGSNPEKLNRFSGGLQRLAGEPFKYASIAEAAGLGYAQYLVKDAQE